MTPTLQFIPLKFYDRNSLIITGIAVATTLVGGGAVCAGLGAQLLLDPMDIKNLQMTGKFISQSW